MLLLTARTARFLLLFVFVAAGVLSAAYSVQDGNAAEESSLVVPERKSIENKIIGPKMVSGYNSNSNSNMKMEKMKEKSERSKHTRKLMHENYQARFVAFNEDYKGPRHHPPKNN